MHWESPGSNKKPTVAVILNPPLREGAYSVFFSVRGPAPLCPTPL